MFTKFTPGNWVAIIGLAGAFATFLMRYESRISKIENFNEEQQHRIERAEGLIRDMFPKLERLNTIEEHRQKKDP